MADQVETTFTTTVNRPQEKVHQRSGAAHDALTPPKNHNHTNTEENKGGDEEADTAEQRTKAKQENVNPTAEDDVPIGDNSLRVKATNFEDHHHETDDGKMNAPGSMKPDLSGGQRQEKSEVTRSPPTAAILAAGHASVSPLVEWSACASRYLTVSDNTATALSPTSLLTSSTSLMTVSHAVSAGTDSNRSAPHTASSVFFTQAGLQPSLDVPLQASTNSMLNRIEDQLSRSFDETLPESGSENVSSMSDASSSSDSSADDSTDTSSEVDSFEGDALVAVLDAVNDSNDDRDGADREEDSLQEEAMYTAAQNALGKGGNAALARVYGALYHPTSLLSARSRK